jgi:alginate O-acetyltransferase complex protein AlgI
MLFNSIEFLVFFPLVTAIYFLLPCKFRWFHLLIASCIFYMYFIPIYILILFLTIIIDYVAGIVIENAAGSKRKSFLVISIVANVGMLMLFKYYNFFAHNINDLVPPASVPYLNIILPIGLSFHTFQAMSYTIEVYRGNQKAEKHLGIYALYVMFFPQLVAGPIERPQNMLYQFYEHHKLEYNNVATGLRLIMWGLVKKVVIADRLSQVVDPFFNHPAGNSGIGFAIASILFAFQIFCDFSAYSDIARGTARVLGFKLMTNFNKPYHARDISEFWKRWHISLSTWFRDYLYISLGGNRVSVPRYYFNLFFVFLVSGIWHGANWTFIIWGALHGFYLVLALITKSTRYKLINALGINKIRWLHNFINMSTTFFLVTFAWIFFRANNIKDSFFIIRKIVSIPREVHTALVTKKIAFLTLPGLLNILLPCFILILLLELAHIVQAKYRLEDTFSKVPTVLRWTLYYSGLFIILFCGVYEKHQFIYFQF